RPAAARGAHAERPLHLLARPGPGLQDGRAEDPRAAADGGTGAGNALRRARVPRRGPRQRPGAAAGAGGADPRVRRRAALTRSRSEAKDELETVLDLPHG